MPVYVKQTRIKAPQQVVFAFHQRPDALKLLVPPWEKVEVEQPPSSLEVGTRVVLVNRLGPLRLRWVALHVAFEPPNFFTDIQEKGPFKRWEHKHSVIEEGQEECLLRDEVTYELPMGLAGRLFGGAFVRRKIEKMFEYRHQVTRAMCESKEASGQA